MISGSTLAPPFLIYDGDCQFCCASIAWLLRRGILAGIDLRPLTSVEPQSLIPYGITARECASYVVLGCAGRISRGGEAFIALAARDARCPSWALKLFRSRAIRTTIDLAYRAVARNRSSLSRLLRRSGALAPIDHCAALSRVRLVPD